MQSNVQSHRQQVEIWSRAGLWTLILTAVSIFTLVVFRSFPQIDVVVSDLFFHEVPCNAPSEEKRCGRFLIGDQKFWQFVREVGHDVPRLLMAFVIVQLTWLLMFNPNKSFPQLFPPIIAVVSALIGPLLLVNLILKEFWGRPRPFQNLWFSGKDPYVLPGDISSYCESNCSFVSGEASAAFWMLALMLYFNGQNRIAFGAIAGTAAVFIAMLRVAFGRHYISDVVMAALMTLAVIAFTIWLMQLRTVQDWMTGLLRFSNTYAFGKRKMKN